MAIIEYLSESSRALGEVADHLSVHKSTASRLLQTLEAGGLAMRAENGTWTIGMRLISIAEQALDSIDIRAVAAPHLRRLEKSCGHTVHLAQLAGKDVVYVDKYEGRDRVRMYSQIGRTVTTYASGLGKAIVAHLEQPLQETIISGLDFRQYTKNTITDVDAFRAELRLIRERGWATDDGEFEEFIACIAAPIRQGDGLVRAGISITTVQALATIDQLRRLVPELLHTADAISRECGWAPR